MKKQNRLLVTVVGFVIVILAFILGRGGVFSVSPTPVAVDVTDDKGEVLQELPQESMAEAIPKALPQDIDSQGDQQAFGEILKDLVGCFDLKPPETGGNPRVAIETIIDSVQGELGPATAFSDRWTIWNFRQVDGSEHQLRMEIGEDDNGEAQRRLKYYTFDKEGQAIEVDLPPDKSDNPTDEVVSQMLKDGNVFHKEKSGFVNFATTDHIDYVEKNGVLSEFEFQKGERFFRCQNLKSTDGCQCVR